MKQYKPTTTALLSTTRDKLKEIAKRENRTPANLMRMIIEDYLEKLETEQDFRWSREG